MSTKLNRALISKILLVLLVAGGAFLLAWNISRKTLDGIQDPMAQLSAPDSALLATQRLFNDVVLLDQLQRLYNLQPAAPTRRSIQSIQQRIHENLDHLQEKTGPDSNPWHALDTIRQLIKEQDRLFQDYHRQRRLHLTNDSLGEQIQLLAEYISVDSGGIDSSLVTTKKIYSQIVNEYDLVPIEEKPSFLARLFGGKKSPPRKTVQTIQKEELIEIDTVRLPPEDSLLAHLGHSIIEGESQRRARMEELIAQRQAMSLASNKLVSTLLVRLNDLEEEGLRQKQQSNQEAYLLTQEGLHDLKLLLILFLVIILLLVLLIISDLYRINRYKSELILARDHAQVQAEARHRFLANMSHEIRSPLQIILGYAEQLNSSELPASTIQERVGLIHQCSRHLLHVVNEVLDYSGITSGQFQLREAPFSPKQALKDVVAIIGFKASDKNLDLKVSMDQGDDEQEKFYGDAFRLRQILINLMDNAIKFTESGYVQVSLKSRPDSSGALFTFEVKDTGIGMDEATLSRLFDAFRAQGDTGKAGSGLGLTITRELVVKQNGTLRVKSEPGQGTKVTVNLYYPYAPKTVQTANLSMEGKPFDEVWLVDDDPLIRTLVSSILKKYEIPYQLFETGQALLERPFPPKSLVILIDIRMPGMNGMDLALALHAREREHPHRIKKVALTAQLLSEIQNDPRGAYFDTLLTKPFEEADLLKAIHWKGHISDIRPVFEIDDRVMRQVRIETEKDLIALSQAAREGNKDRITGLLHKLAGRFGQIQWMSEHKKCREKEIRWSKQDAPPSPEDVESLIVEIRARLADL